MQPVTGQWLRETNTRDDVVITVPLSVTEDGVAWVLGAMIFGEEAVSLVYNDFSSWNLLTEYSFEHEFSVYGDDLLEPTVGLIHGDARAVPRLASRLAETLHDATGLAFSPYATPQMAETIEHSQQSCHCKSISEPQVKPVPGLSGIDGERVYMCADCSKTHGIEYNRRAIRNEKAFDPNWILEDETAEGFIDTETDSDYLLYTTGENIGKLEHVIGLMAMIGGGISNSFSAYVPNKHEALVYVMDDAVAGYLTWAREGDGRQSLQQLFTRSEYRNEGVASILVTSWVDEFCEGDTFYVEEPNEKSRALFEKLGYVDGQPEAVEHYLLRGITNDLEDGMQAADSVSKAQNAL